LSGYNSCIAAESLEREPPYVSHVLSASGCANTRLLGAELEPIVAMVIVGETLLAVLFPVAIVFAARHKGLMHHYVMLTAFLVDALLLKMIMVARLMDGAWGEFPWTYFDTMLPHVLAATASDVLGVLTIYLGFRHRVRNAKGMFLPARGMMHRVSGAMFIISWYTSLILGMSVFSLTYY